MNKKLNNFIKDKNPIICSDGSAIPTALVFLKDNDEVNIHYGSRVKKQKRIEAFLEALDEINSCDGYEVEEGAHILVDLIYGKKDCYGDPDDEPYNE